MAAVLGSRTTWQLRYHQLPDRSKNSISSKIASRTTSNQQKVQKLPADKYIFDRCKIKNENSKIQNFKWIESRPRNRTTEHATEATRKKHQLCNFNFCNFKFCNFGNIETHRHSHRISCLELIYFLTQPSQGSHATKKHQVFQPSKLEIASHRN